MLRLAAAACLPLLVLTAAPALALCSGESLFHCPIGKKELELCRQGNSVTYTFGPAGRPEITLSESIRSLDYQPWSGVGRAIHQAAVFENDGVFYRVWSSFDRQLPDEPATGGVLVERNEQLLAQLNCASGRMEAGLDLLWQAKEQAGQCWNYQKFRWQEGGCG
ncbi:hypothetical protein [Pseudogemmobacter faecipullorum]|uniref:Uncharacterized protein n=1 Tax=Pseudogemmobacter faecipullorum TaxID=2755041 RepID=A0ABS8CKF4_9RHOB|nr:hypothetical protein [Pseudogemmobacter faecipullorum]MCB5409855.1 hypothetical protein [Pseudogemmobacter faecipullorum]